MAILLLAIGLLGVYLARAAILTAAGRWLDLAETPRQVEAVVVLPGGVTTRPFAAAALVRAGLAQRVLVPQSFRDAEAVDELSPADDFLLRQVLRKRGVPDGKIVLLEGSSQSTSSDAQAVAQWLLANNVGSLAVVTNGMHSRRTRWIFEDTLQGMSVNLTIVSVPNDGFGPANWWRVQDGMRAYTTELLKLCAYWLRYRHGLLWTALVVAGIVAIAAAVRSRRIKKAVGAMKSTDG
ncbi:MAG TPA: YdcF family protein [Pirellulales bacterium]|nr:YdcF family protein [Pirellulales bacterium]